MEKQSFFKPGKLYIVSNKFPCYFSRFNSINDVNIANYSREKSFYFGNIVNRHVVFINLELEHKSYVLLYIFLFGKELIVLPMMKNHNIEFEKFFVEIN